MDDVFKALADPSRRHILDVLFAQDGQTLGALCLHLDMARQSVSKHLRILERARLVECVWHGREKLHYLNPTPLHEIHVRWLSKYDGRRLAALAALKKELEQDEQ